MVYCNYARSFLVLVWLFYGFQTQALEILPPMPAECKAADKIQDLQTKINLYTSCLEQTNSSDRKMDDWQRKEVYLHRADALFEMGHYAEAIVDYDRYIGDTSFSVWALHRRGMSHNAIGQYQQAIADLDAALEITPGALDVRYDRGLISSAQGNYQLALEDFRQVTAEAPDTPEYANALAWLLSTCPDAKLHNGKLAVRLAHKALSQNRNPNYLDTLAAAYARSGKFQRAIEVQKEALKLLQHGHASPETIKELNSRLNLYSVGKPYAESLRE